MKTNDGFDPKVIVSGLEYLLKESKNDLDDYSAYLKTLK